MANVQWEKKFQKSFYPLNCVFTIQCSKAYQLFSFVIQLSVEKSKKWKETKKCAKNEIVLFSA